MIPYEELCAALEQYAATHQGAAPSAELPPLDAPTGEHAMPHVTTAGADDEHTNVGLEPIYDDRSNELDIGDVLSDEDAHKN